MKLLSGREGGPWEGHDHGDHEEKHEKHSDHKDHAEHKGHDDHEDGDVHVWLTPKMRQKS